MVKIVADLPKLSLK